MLLVIPMLFQSILFMFVIRLFLQLLAGHFNKRFLDA